MAERSRDFERDVEDLPLERLVEFMDLGRPISSLNLQEQPRGGAGGPQGGGASQISAVLLPPGRCAVQLRV